MPVSRRQMPIESPIGSNTPLSAFYAGQCPLSSMQRDADGPAPDEFDDDTMRYEMKTANLHRPSFSPGRHSRHRDCQGQGPASTMMRWHGMAWDGMEINGFKVGRGFCSALTGSHPAESDGRDKPVSEAIRRLAVSSGKGAASAASAATWQLAWRF